MTRKQQRFDLLDKKYKFTEFLKDNPKIDEKDEEAI